MDAVADFRAIADQERDPVPWRHAAGGHAEFATVDVAAQGSAEEAVGGVVSGAPAPGVLPEGINYTSLRPTSVVLQPPPLTTRPPARPRAPHHRRQESPRRPPPRARGSQ